MTEKFILKTENNFRFKKQWPKTNDEIWDSNYRTETTGIKTAAERSSENVKALNNVKPSVSLLGRMNAYLHSVPCDAQFVVPPRLFVKSHVEWGR